MEQKINIGHPQECLDIFDKIINNEYNEKDKKYASYVSMGYFLKNLDLFKEEKINEILNNQDLKKFISVKSGYELLENAIKNKKIFTSYSKKWFYNTKSNQELLNQYLELLLENSDNKQIEDFCKVNPELSKRYYILHSRNNANHIFELYVLGNNPKLIKYNKTLNESEIMEIFNKGLAKYENLLTCFDRISYKNQSIIASEITQFLMNTPIEDLNKEDRNLYLDKFAMNSSFFMRKIQELNPDLLKKILIKEGIESIGNHPQTILNLLQSLVYFELKKPDQNNIYQLLNIVINDYKDILFQDVIEKTGLIKFEGKDSYLEYLFKNKHYPILIALSYFNEKLNDKEKELILAATLNSIVEKYKINQSESYVFDVKKEVLPLFNFENSLIESYLPRLKKIEKIDDIIYEIEKVILCKSLDTSLEKLGNNPKKNKI